MLSVGPGHSALDLRMLTFKLECILYDTPMCVAAPETFVFPTASAIADNLLNVHDRAEKIN